MPLRLTGWIRLFLLLLVAVATGTAVWLAGTSHESFTALVFSRVGEPDKLAKFRSDLLTPQRFETLQIIMATVALLTVCMALYAWNRLHRLPARWKSVGQAIHQTIHQVKEFWYRISPAERLAVSLLFGLIAALRLYFLFRFPFHIDERFTYLYFVSKGWGVSLAYYPNPNNHILFTLLCNATDLFLDNPWWVMKLPGLLTGLALVVAFWLVMRYGFDVRTAWVATVLFAFSESVFYYGTQGRGYNLLLLFVLISAFSALQITRKPRETIWYGCFWLSSTLGFYTIPIFLYPFAGNLLFLTIRLIGQRNRQAWKRMLVAILLTAGSVFVLYLPVFLFNGWTAVSGNAWVQPLPWTAFMAAYPAHTGLLLAGNWGGLPFGQWLTAGLLAYSLALLFRPNEAPMERVWAALWLSNLVSLTAISLLQRLLLFQRVALYLSIFQYVLLALLIIRLLKWIFRKSWLPAIGIVCVMFAGLATYSLYQLTDPKKFSWYDSFDTTAALLYQRRADSLFVNYYEYSLCIRFLYETSGRTIGYMDVNQPVAGIPYQYLVLHKSHPFPATLRRSTYQMIYSDPEVKVYKLMTND